MNAAHRFDGERRCVFDVAVHDPLEPVADADDLDAFELTANGSGRDDAVDTRRRPAGDENCEACLVSHTRGRIVTVLRLETPIKAAIVIDGSEIFSDLAADALKAVPGLLQDE